MPTPDKPKLLYIGSGPISDFHIPALKEVGFEIILQTSRAQSGRSRAFAETHDLPHSEAGWQEVLASAPDCDGVVIAIETGATPEIVETAKTLGKPILLEKPGAWASDHLAQAGRGAEHRIMLAYNRRFYAPSQAARAFVANGAPLQATLTVPESRTTLRQFFVNSCHALDLAYFILGPLKLVHVHHHRLDGRIAGLSALLTTERGDQLTFVGNWKAPDNFKLSLDRPGERYFLCPFEHGVRFDGMSVIEPTPEAPIRRYVPKEAEVIPLTGADLTFKPGFVAQAMAFKTLVETGTPPEVAASFEDGVAILRLCEALTKPVDDWGDEAGP